MWALNLANDYKDLASPPPHAADANPGPSADEVNGIFLKPLGLAKGGFRP
jgi:hypothetical protein